MMLSPSEFLDDAPDTIGAQVHVNHKGCSAGDDTKKRLYIKRTSDGTVLAYCHHCGLSGVSRSKYRHIHSYRTTTYPHSGVSTSGLRMPVDADRDTTKWPREALAWLIKYGILVKEISDYGIAYSPRYNRVCFPLYMDGVYIGWQGRAVNDVVNPPKYLTFVDSKNPTGNVAVFRQASRTSRVVIVEDCVSAIKVNRTYDSIALLGSHVSDDTVIWIADRYPEVCIWLDNDKPEVLREQTRLNRLFSVLGKSKLVLTNRDPKCYSDAEIKKYVG